MKKITTLLVFSFLFVSAAMAQNPMYYNYNTTSGGNAFPFSVPAGKTIQWIYLAGEINQPSSAPSGYITRVYFRCATATVTYTSITIRMGDTTLTSLPAGAFYTGPLDTVFYRTNYTISSVQGSWISITLDKPFRYDNTRSLIIEASQCGCNVSGMTIYNTTQSGNRRTYNQTAGGCNYIFQGQSGTLANLGIDLVPNCGYTWATQTSGTTLQLYSVKAVNDMIAWVGGATATVRMTTNGGVNWNNGNPNPGVINGAIYAIEAIDANNAWCTTSPTATFIYRTTNGGVNWTQVFTQVGGFIDDIKFINANTGFAYGDPVAARWSLWKSTDGGATWDSSGLYLAQAGSEAGWNNAMFILGNTIWFGTSNTRIYKSPNFGATGSWTFGATTGQANSFSLHFNSPLLGLMGGSTGALRTTNGGATWGSITILGSGSVTGMEGFGTDFWYTRGTGIYRSTNSGDNWTQVFTAAGSLSDIDLWASTGCLQGWAVGATGTIAKMNGIPVGIGNNNNEIPGTFKLEQNYPNPFNPATVIRYQLSVNSFVSLKVFDVLGREVAVAVDKVLLPGEYEVTFDASELASGIYYYTLIAPGYTETKKMILTK